ncbi:MAG: FtsX-like permease family protein [Lachnospiraceae bacterium]|nr:FtsX-like permease family protein [Lachnospiraceae bacterium]
MNRFFYGKLAFGNLKKNGRLYLPYMLAAIGIGAMFYIMLALTADEGIGKMPGAAELKMIMGLGCGVIMVFAVIFLFYTNSFLMKRRKKEFGLFHILGMEKRHIGKMMFWETCMVGFISIAGAAAAGVVLYKLVVLVLLRITGLEVPFGFTISVSGIGNMAICFAAIFLATMLYNLVQVKKANAIELLHSANQGEKEPKTRWFLAILGVLALGGGYVIAIVAEDPLGALLMFFVAVLLVILGTYCLFTAGSIALLKIMRKNKTYFYKTKHFISVSGMIYRMKQNAVGLANICILSTMVLVMVSGTISLYLGMEDIINTQYPRDIAITGSGSLTDGQKSDLKGMFQQAAAESGQSVEGMVEYTTLDVTVWKSGGNMVIANPEDEQPEGTLCVLEILTLEEYNRVAKEPGQLQDDEIFVCVRQGEAGDTSYSLNGKNLRIKEYLEDFQLEGMDKMIIYDGYFLVVKDRQVMQELYEMQKAVYGERASVETYSIFADLSGDPGQMERYEERFLGLLEEYNQTKGEGETIAAKLALKDERREAMMVFCGGFLFLGVFLGFVFLMATVLIIYYKQVSEGYEDKGRFEIMRKVGMSPKEVKASIHSQIMKVFFLPLVMAGVHLTMAFPMMNRLLMLFNLRNPGLFAACTVVVVCIFAGIYGIVFGITAKAYYQIVGEQR